MQTDIETTRESHLEYGQIIHESHKQAWYQKGTHKVIP